MANRCAALDPAWTHLPAAGHCHYSTPSSSWLFPGAAAAFENEALTNALRASMSPAANANPSAAASSSSYPTTPSSSSTTSSASELFSADAPGAPAPAAAASSRPGGVPPLARAIRAGPKSGRVTKRKPRPSRRPPVTYITADPANFRRMVQEVTGFPVVATGLRRHPSSEPAPSCWPAAPPAPACFALPTLDTSAFLLLDRASVPPAPGRLQGDDAKSSSGGDEDASPAMAAAIVTEAAEEEAAENGEDDDTSLMLELEAMACAPALVSDDFPTLDSWGII